MSEYVFNLARRHSVKNEPDLLQEEMVNGIPRTPPSSPYTKKECFSMIQKVCPDSPLPTECKEFKDVQSALQRRNSNQEDQAIAFQGMHAGEAANARIARERGVFNPAQIQRRMTSTKERRSW